MNKKEFEVIIEKDGDNWLIANVPELKRCHTQAENMKNLMKNVKEVIELYSEVKNEKNIKDTSFVRIKKWQLMLKSVKTRKVLTILKQIGFEKK